MAGKTGEYYAVESGECYEWIPIRPVSRIDDSITPQDLLGEFRVVDGHPHLNHVFHHAGVLIKTLPHVPIQHLAKIQLVERQQ